MNIELNVPVVIRFFGCWLTTKAFLDMNRGQEEEGVEEAWDPESEMMETSSSTTSLVDDRED